MCVYSAIVDVTMIRDRIMKLKLKEFINEMNAAELPLDDILAGITEVRAAIYDLVSNYLLPNATYSKKA